MIYIIIYYNAIHILIKVQYTNLMLINIRSDLIRNTIQ